MKNPFGHAEPKTKKFVGMSKRSNPVDKIKNDVHIPKLQISDRNIFHSLQPFIEIIKEDIKTLFKKDKKSIQAQREYEDFIENHFGGNK